MAMAESPDNLKTALREGLRNTYVFANFPDEDLESVAHISKWVNLGTRAEIIKKDLPNDHIFVLMDGLLLVEERLENGTDVVFAHITPGNVVGELSFVDKQVASATIRCDGPCEIIQIRQSDLSALFKSRTQLENIFLRELVLTLSNRLRNTNKDLVRAMRYLA